MAGPPPHQTRQHRLYPRNARRLPDLGRVGRHPRRTARLYPVLQILILPRPSARNAQSLGRRHVVSRRLLGRRHRHVAVQPQTQNQYLENHGFRRTARSAGFGFRPYRQLYQRRTLGSHYRHQRLLGNGLPASARRRPQCRRAQPALGGMDAAIPCAAAPPFATLPIRA